MVGVRAGRQGQGYLNSKQGLLTQVEISTVIDRGGCYGDRGVAMDINPCPLQGCCHGYKPLW